LSTRGPLPVNRRQFLARCGLLGAGAVLGNSGFAALARAATNPVADLAAASGPFMRQLAQDTIAGLVVMAVPGPDPYSRAQGVSDSKPGAIEAKAHLLVLEALDDFLPLPDTYAQALAASFANGVSDGPLPAGAFAQFARDLEQQSITLDQVLRAFMTSDGAVPLSLLIAMMLNFEASGVSMAALGGPFPSSPFANLTFAQKAKVFENLETAQSDLVQMLDANFPEPLRQDVSGLLKYVGGTLLEFAAYTPFSEYAVYDPQTRRTSGRPVGWEITHYLPGRTTPVDGQPELRGYWRGKRKSLGPAPAYRSASRRSHA
jgi:hypothetical protein